MTLTPPDMLLDPIISEKSLSMIYAKRGVGKTYFALNIAIALATGTSFLSYKTKQASPVLYVDEEDYGELLKFYKRKKLYKAVIPSEMTTPSEYLNKVLMYLKDDEDLVAIIKNLLPDISAPVEQELLAAS